MSRCVSASSVAVFARGAGRELGKPASEDSIRFQGDAGWGVARKAPRFSRYARYLKEHEEKLASGQVVRYLCWQTDIAYH